MDELLITLRRDFPGTVPASTFYTDLSQRLETGHGFTPANTLFVDGACSDELNEPELHALAERWEGRFRLGGLAGYCHGGRTGLAAAAAHAPAEDGRGHLLVVAGPHIGWHEGRWGMVRRPGQTEATASCGALTAAVTPTAALAAPPDPLDAQQQVVERILSPFVERDRLVDEPFGLVRATRFFLDRVDTDLETIVEDVAASFDIRVACVTGMTINTVAGNFLCPSRQRIRDRGATIDIAVAS